MVEYGYRYKSACLKILSPLSLTTNAPADSSSRRTDTGIKCQSLLQRRGSAPDHHDSRFDQEGQFGPGHPRRIRPRRYAVSPEPAGSPSPGLAGDQRHLESLRQILSSGALEEFSLDLASFHAHCGLS